MLLSSAMTACTQETVTPLGSGNVQAHGQSWSYNSREYYTKSWGFDSPHGLFGANESVRYEIELGTASGETLNVSDRLSALQRDGTYRSVTCCLGVQGRPRLYVFDNNLTIALEQPISDLTDCIVYPPDRQSAAKQSEYRVNYAFVFGEFDPERRLFLVNTFFPGGIDETGYRKQLGVDPSQYEIDVFFFKHRVPFQCK